MTTERYDELFKDKTVIKFGVNSNAHLLSKSGTLVVSFTFMHAGFPHYSPKPEKRIFLKVFPKDHLNVDIPLIKVNNEVLILVNAENRDYAQSFLIEINEGSKSVNAKVLDFPELGQTLITETEKEGLTHMCE